MLRLQQIFTLNTKTLFLIRRDHHFSDIRDNEDIKRFTFLIIYFSFISQHYNIKLLIKRKYIKDNEYL